MELRHRYRRLRRGSGIRSLARECRLSVGDFIYPMFVVEGEGIRREISTMPGNFHLSIDKLVAECEHLLELGIPAVNLFGYSEDKDDLASGSYDDQGLVQRAVRALKNALPELYVQTDVALDPYTNHGHDGLVEGDVTFVDAVLGQE